MVIDTITEILPSYLGSLKESPKHWMTTNCPLCIHRGHNPDRRGRFGVKYESDSIAVSCFNCAFKSKFVQGQTISKDFSWFLSTIGIPSDDLKKIKFQAFREKEAGNIFQKSILAGKVTHKWKEIALPDDSMTIVEWLSHGCNDPNLLQTAMYVLDRKLNPEDVYWTPVVYGKKQFNKRFILPFYYNSKIVGYTARYAKDVQNKNIYRYINNLPDSYVYNLDNQTDYNKKYCLVHEGVLDAYVTTGVSCMGSINQDQIELINSLGKEVIVCPDRDKDGEKLIDVAIDQGWGVSFPKWAPDIKDAGKAAQVYGRLLTVKSIVDSVEKTKLKIHISRRMDKFK